MDTSKNKQSTLPPFSFLNNWENKSQLEKSNGEQQLPSSSTPSPEFLNNSQNSQIHNIFNHNQSNNNQNNNNSNINNQNNTLNSSNNNIGNNNNNNNSKESSYEKMMATTLDSIGKMEAIQKKYEKEIESLMNQIQTYIEREQKQRVHSKSIEDINARLENENIQLKKELFDISRKLKEVERSDILMHSKIQSENILTNNNNSTNNNNNNNQSFYNNNSNANNSNANNSNTNNNSNNSNNNSLGNSFNSIFENSNGNISNNNNNNINSNNNNNSAKKKTSIIGGNNGGENKRKGRNNLDGDDEAALVAEALGSFGDYASKPILKRSNSEEFGSRLPNKNGNNGNNDWVFQEQKIKKRKESSFDDEQQQLQNNNNNINNNVYNQQQQQPQQQKVPSSVLNQQLSNAPPSLSSSNQNIPPPLLRQNSKGSNSLKDLINVKTEKSNNNNNNNNQNSLSKSGNHFPSSLSQASSIPEMETDVENDEFDFNRKEQQDDDSPDNEMSRNSSSPIDEPISDINLFKIISPGSPQTPQETLLNEIHGLQNAQRDMLEKMYMAQKQFLSEPGYNEEMLHTLQNEQVKLSSQIESEIQALNQMYSQTILEPNQLCKLDILLQDISIQLKQLHLYQMELNYGGNDPFPATLVITKQPFPMVISKFKQLQEDHLCVQLLTGANVDIISYSPIKAELIFHGKALTKGSINGNLGSASASASASVSASNNPLKRHIDKDTQTLDPVKGIAKFPIKFMTGTRKSCVKLHFVLQIKTSDGSIINVPSSTSQPFIVITNDCQWEGSEGTLLKKESFNEKFEITWPHFVNILQKHFLKATKQSPIQPTRPLSHYDFQYLNNSYFKNKTFVSHKDFDAFWAWFGKSIQTLRYKRHISTLWQNGLIFMFLKRETINQILKNQDSGTFIILFSEAFPGQLEISYVGTEKDSSTKVKHYLVQSNDTSGSKRTLPDFLNECPQFTHILQLNVSMIPQTETIPIFKREPKNVVLEPYYSKRQTSQNIMAQGYDPL